ncbi:MAG: hypothetical protein ACRCX2_19765 [Paraclostridium sp.]
MSINKTLPGFLLTIEDNMAPTVAVPAIKDVYVIYGILPETMKYKDEDGNVYDKFIEANKPLLIATGGREDAITTLELSDIELTREIRNMLALMPEDATIALCRIALRNGEQPDQESMSQMFEALDFAFESTENYPMKEIYCAGMSLDKAVSLVPNQFSIVKASGINDSNLDEMEIKAMITNIGNYEGGSTVTVSKNAVISFNAERTGPSSLRPDGILNKFEFRINGITAMMLKPDGSTVPFSFEYEVTYDDAGSEAAAPGVATTETGLSATLGVLGNKLQLALPSTSVKFVLDDQSVVLMNLGTININTLGNVEDSTARPNQQKIDFNISKISATADILGRILKHNSTITATQNNCRTFLAPEAPRNGSTKAIGEWVDHVEALYEKVRERCMSVNSANGKKVDLGMFLSSPVGVNRLGTIGGISGFPQSTIASIEENKIITQKPTSSFEVGDIVEVYSHDKLDIVTLRTTVTNVSLSATGTTELTLKDPISSQITSTRSPKYVMNVNNKDFTGNYMAIQYSNICKLAGVKRSPAGLAWPGECQVMFSEAQKNRLNACKYAVLMQKHGTVQGEVDKSQLMTSTTSQFQDYENLETVYELVKGAKEIGMEYRGKRINSTTDMALIKTEIQGQVFDPAVGVFIEPGYELSLVTKMLQAPNGKKEKALFINFAVTEIQTMKLLRMTARLS